MPIVVFKDKSSIPQELQSEVTEKDGSFEVNLSLTTKVTEFRENNTKLSKERDELLTQNKIFKDIVGEDADEFSEALIKMKSTQQQVDDGKLTVKSDIEAELAKRTENMKAQHASEISQKDTKIKELGDSNLVLDTRIKRNAITTAVQAVINSKDSGIHATAWEDISSRAMNRFNVEGNNEIIARDDENGIIYGANGSDPESISEWIEGLKAISPHFFKTSNGGGGGGGDNKYGGLSPEEYGKLTGKEKLSRHNDRL